MNSKLSANRQNATDYSLDSFSVEISETIFNHVQEGILLFDEKGNLVRINSQGLKMHGLKQPDDFEFFEVLDPEGRKISEFMFPVARLMKNETFYDEPYLVKMQKDGPELKIIYSGKPIFNAQGKFSEGVLFARSMPVHNVRNDLTRYAFEPNEQLKRLEAYQQQQRRDRDHLKAVIDTIPVMITVYDKSLKTFEMNRAFEKITGWSYHDIAGTNIMELAYPDPLYRREVYEFMQSMPPDFKDIILRTRDGRSIHTSWANVELPDGRQVGIGIDISERKLLEKQLREEREKAIADSKNQYAFIQNISHEVRTPMNSILGFTDLLKKEIKNKKEAEFLNAISYNGKQLLRLIDDIIDFSQLDNNKVSIYKEPVCLINMLNQVEMQIEGIRKAYKKRFLKIYMKYPDNIVRVIMNTDELRLQQVFLNLIDNAIKYTEKGSVEIGYEICQEKKDILFYVKDSGIGIDAKRKNEVFKRFNRLHDTHTKEFRGAGLGLAICKHLVKLLGGEIWFDSKPGEGTVFYFTHPYHVLEEEIRKTEENIFAIPQNQDISVPDLNGKVILIAEDDSFSYMMLYHMLEETKAMIIHADTGRKAIDFFDKYNPDMVLLDIRLPELDGYEVIRYLKHSNKKVPVIAQTANALPEDRRKIREAGFSYHITKPISRECLYEVLEKFL